MMSKVLIGLAAAAMAVLVACSGGGSGASNAGGAAAPTPENYCELMRSYAGRYRQGPLPSGSPREIRRLYEDTAADLADALAAAPPEIRADVATVAAGLDRVMAVLDRLDYDPARLVQSPDALEGIDTPEFEAAGQRVEAYARDVCGP